MLVVVVVVVTAPAPSYGPGGNGAGAGGAGLLSRWICINLWFINMSTVTGGAGSRSVVYSTSGTSGGTTTFTIPSGTPIVPGGGWWCRLPRTYRRILVDLEVVDGPGGNGAGAGGQVKSHFSSAQELSWNRNW